MAKKASRKLPRNAIEMLTSTCEMLSEECGKPATEIFKGFLELMNKYAYYFFSKPWPEKYNIDEATTFTDEDLDFVFRGKKSELFDRYMTMSLKKNVNMEIGFQGVFGIYWTQEAFEERFFRPFYKPVLEAFEKLKQENKNAREVLDNLKKQFPLSLIHESFVDLKKQRYPDQVTRELMEEIFRLLHDAEGFEPCSDILCDWYRDHKYPKSDGGTV